MFLNTHAGRQLKALIAASFAAVLVATITPQVANASAPHESSRIGSGYSSTGAGQHAPAPAPWSARIGTGRVGAVAPTQSSTAPPSVHWSAGIGTGNASRHTEIIS
jgi:hypothetical protein